MTSAYADFIDERSRTSPSPFSHRWMTLFPAPAR
jgi:hypothetical protein